jgi:hypothetical protein
VAVAGASDGVIDISVGAGDDGEIGPAVVQPANSNPTKNGLNLPTLNRFIAHLRNDQFDE